MYVLFCFLNSFIVKWITFYWFSQSFEESQSERGQKYRDLRKREHVMDEFLSSWENNCTSEKDRLKELETQITQTLSKIGKQQSLMQLVPRYPICSNIKIATCWILNFRFSISDYSSAKEDYLMKEGELEKSRATLEGIAIEYQRLQNNLQKVYVKIAVISSSNSSTLHLIDGRPRN